MNKLKGAIARPDGSLVRGEISFNEKIASIESAPAPADDYILPGLIDLQVNGSHGLDVMTAGPEALHTLGAHLAMEGTVAWMPTAVTAPWDRIARAHDAIAGAMEDAAPPRDSAAILGMHLEGPFISPRRLGAHPKLNLAPHGDVLESALKMRALRLITLAPELEGALEAIGRLTARGVVVSMGHTDATLEEANAGIAAGARMFTHLYNAMRPLNHRDPGVIAAALAPSPAFAAVIPDGVHVHPEMIRLAYRSRGRDGMLMVTDKVALAGTQNSLAAEVGRARASVRDGAVRLADGTLAGSIISMLDGVRILVERCAVSIADAAVLAATNPATLIGMRDRGRLQVGARADLIVLDRKLELKSVVVGGREIG